jgi:hypothetical protein
MGAVESLDHCCADRAESYKSGQYFGTWKAKEAKSKKIDLNRDYGNGAAICDDPLKDLKLDKSIDSELTHVFKEVGHRFPCPIHGQEQLTKLLTALKKRGYSFPGTDEKLCARVWSMHHCSRITILQFRAWFHAEVVVSVHNLRVLMGHSRWVSGMLERMYSECELADNKMEAVRKVVNTLRQYLEEDPISSADVHRTFEQVISKDGKMNYLLSGRGKILEEDFQALVQQMLVDMYFEHFNASLYSYREEDAAASKQTLSFQASKEQFPGATACCLPTTESGMDRWRSVSESLPCGNANAISKSKKLPGSALPLGHDNRALARSLKFPVGSKVPVGAVAA